MKKMLEVEVGYHFELKEFIVAMENIWKHHYDGVFEVLSETIEWIKESPEYIQYVTL